MTKIAETISLLIMAGKIPIAGKFEVTEQLMYTYYITYSSLKEGTSKIGKFSNLKMARRLAGINLLKENISRGVGAKEIKAGLIYLIENPAFNNHYKIGITFDLLKRLQSYQTYSPFRDFKVVKYDFVVDKLHTEKELLRYTKLVNAEGEWVEKSNALEAFDSLARTTLDIWITRGV